MPEPCVFILYPKSCTTPPKKLSCIRLFLLAFLHPNTRRIRLCSLVSYDQKKVKMKKSEKQNQHRESDQNTRGQEFPEISGLTYHSLVTKKLYRVRKCMSILYDFCGGKNIQLSGGAAVRNHHVCLCSRSSMSCIKECTQGVIGGADGVADTWSVKVLSYCSSFHLSTGM